jgi:hypothetical protein
MRKSLEYCGINLKAAIVGVSLRTAAATLAAGEAEVQAKPTSFRDECVGLRHEYSDELGCGRPYAGLDRSERKVVFSFGPSMAWAHSRRLEVFQERAEPPIIDLESALGCEHSDDAISLTELFITWPAGW